MSFPVEGRVFRTTARLARTAEIVDLGPGIWSNPGNALDDQDSSASASLQVLSSPTVTITDALYLSAFGFNLPGEARVQGITVRIRARSSSGTQTGFVVPAVGGSSGDDDGIAKTVRLSSTFNVFRLGDGRDGFRSSFLVGDKADEVNDEDWGVWIYAPDQPAGWTMHVDWVRVAIHYRLRGERARTSHRARGALRPPLWHGNRTSLS